MSKNVKNRTYPTTMLSLFSELRKHPRMLEELKNRNLPRTAKAERTIQSIFSKFGGLSSDIAATLWGVARLGTTDLRTLCHELGTDLSICHRNLTLLIEKGYIQKEELEDTSYYLLAPIWRDEKFPSGPIIPIIYQFNLLSDESRVSGFAGAIRSLIKKNSVVAELGAGVGLLSLLAAEKARKVYAVELDPVVADYGARIVEEHSLRDKIDYIVADGRSVELPEKVDVVVCEMIDTALVAELQVPVMNFAINEFLKRDGLVIPQRAVTTAQLTNVDYYFGNYKFKLPHYEEYGARTSKIVLSDEFVLDDVDFSEVNPIQVEKEVSLRARTAGVVNGLRLRTVVEVAPGQTIPPSSWFNPPVTLPLDDRTVKENDIITIKLSWIYGGGWEKVKILEYY